MVIRRTLVATGCSSGIGAAALQHLIDSAPSDVVYSLILGSRSSPAPQPIAISSPHTITYLLLDLSSFTSVKTFATAVTSLLNGDGADGRIDVLLLNAGVFKAAEVESVGGWCEEAIVNHFAQHYLVLLLWPVLVSSTETTTRGRIVVTSSSLHHTIQSRDHLRDLLRPGSAPSPTPTADPKASPSKQRYSASKFVQMVSAHSWAGELSEQVDVIAVSPGFIPGTGLNRETSFLSRVFLRHILSWAPFCSTLAQGAEGISRAITLVLPETAPGRKLLYIDNKGVGLEPSSLIREGGTVLQTEWTPGVAEMESWR